MAPSEGRHSAAEVSLFRLYLLRVLYLLIFVGQGFIQWSAFFHHATPWTFWRGVGFSMLAGLSLAAAIGIRYPLRMLPLLLFELFWKAIWLLAIALPMALAHRVDPDTLETAKECLWGVVLCPIVIPWPYVIANYVKKPGDRWR